MLKTVVLVFSLLLGVINASEIHQEKVASLDKARKYFSLSANTSCGFAAYKQCNSSYGSDPLGTGGGQTICSAGCAMSSVAEMLLHWKVAMDPGQLNKWLDTHNGYEDGDLIVWSSVDVLGPTFIAIENPTSEELQNGINQCHGLIANVMNGEHWVLITGYMGNNNFYVNDPGFDNAYYPYDQMVRVAVYH